jgi:hypothetical protein
MKYFSIITCCCVLFIPFLSLGVENLQEEPTPPSSRTPFSLFIDNAIPLTDRDLEYLNRADNNSLNGNDQKAVDNIKDLIARFITFDKQLSVIYGAFLLTDKFIDINDLNSAALTLKDIEYRIGNFLISQNSLVEKLRLQLNCYKHLLTIINNKDNPILLESLITPIKTLMKQISSAQNLDKSMMILYYSLGLIYKQEKKEQKSLNNFYESLKIANTLFDFQYYYKASSEVINIYLKQKKYSKAYNRISGLNQLFTNVKKSSYFKMKIIVKLANIYADQHNTKKAIGMLERAYELLTSNISLDPPIKKRLLDNLKWRIQAQKALLRKDNFFQTNYSFFLLDTVSK